ncbi:vacuole morphology and inheritance protein 14 [[Candida] jaroonii]|uniref:Vacuole morphology and inheritance protein 14 n=1 Tax=[Candida] jaroonii TaxID=467808 RepID=A0ACA9Y887_9ASCO|nr:vacuole morphology and inheritance protein 14 [[Candida] jaroonii]
MDNGPMASLTLTSALASVWYCVYLLYIKNANLLSTIMEDQKVLDASIIKDLSNHIYEKRKATAFQIESLTKSALARNDSQTIYNIVKELGDLTVGDTNSARMGAITALGSVSVALGSFPIAYFLDDIIKPIFATFRDTDARVRYYACESLYNIAKIARGEILVYFNEVFDILCILITDSESSVKNAADILDRLIKDIVSAKATNYVSILQQEQQQQQQEDDFTGIKTHTINDEGVALQMNEIQDAQKAFSLPKFIPTLLERMYTIDPFAKKFLISWLELFDDIPSLELITFLPNFLDPLIKFLKNNAPSDIRIETQNLLNVFLKEIKSITKVKHDVRRRQIIQEKNKSNKTDEVNDKLKDIDIKDEVNEEESIKSEEIKDEPPELEKQEHSESQPALQEEEEEEEFLEGQDIFIDYQKIINILLSFIKEKDAQPNDLTVDGHEITLEIQFIVLRWLNEIIQISPLSFTNFFPDCVTLTMQNIALSDNNKDFDLRNNFLKFNLSLQSFFIKLNEAGVEKEEQEEDIDEQEEINEDLVLGLNKEIYEDFIEFQLLKTLHTVMRECLTSANELARITSLDWLIFLYSREPSSFVDLQGENNTIDLTALLQSATDSSNEVISKVLQLLSKISETNQDFFKDFMNKLINFFENEIDEQIIGGSNLTRNKIDFIIRKLCVTLDSEKIFKTISEVLGNIKDVNLEFLNMIIVTLNNILLTSPELAKFRKKLKNLDVYKAEDWSLFSTLFTSWCHNSASAISLCLLTSNYDLSFLIIKSISESEVTFQLLTQLDILVQLLESPIFLKLRLQLLEPEKNPYLFKTLYGLLMILPQSSTYTILHNRLSSISTVINLNGTSSSSILGTTSNISTPVTTPNPSTNPANSITQQLSIKRKRVYEMLEKFNRVQESHENNQLDKKLRESATSSLYNEDIFRKTIDSKSDRILSYTSEKTEDKKGKRLGSGRFGLR